MRRLFCSLALVTALVSAWGSGLCADETAVANDLPAPAPFPSGAAPKPANLLPSAMPMAGESAGKTMGSPAGKTATAVGPASTNATAVPPGPPSVEVAINKLKAQIKTVRLSLADTTGRLAVTEKNLSSVTNENDRLRTENTSLHVNLTKAETVAKKTEEELQHRRREINNLIQQPKTSSSGSGFIVVGLLLLLGVAVISAMLLFGQGNKLSTIMARLPEGKQDDRRQEQQLRAKLKDEQQKQQEQLKTQLKDEQKKQQEQLRAQLKGELEKEQEQLKVMLKDEQQKALRLEEECKRLRDEMNRSNVPAGSKREKLDNMRRELRELRASTEAEKRKAEERIRTLEAEVAKLTEEKQKLEVAVEKAMQKLAFLGHDEPEEAVSPPASDISHEQELPPSVGSS